jgi:hypothetical protein
MMRRTLLYIGVALICACAVFLDLQSGDSLRYKDEVDYSQLAHSILHRFEFFDETTGQLVIGRPPGYPAAIVLAYLVAERPLAAKLQNAVFLLLAVMALVTLTRRLEPRAAPLVPYLVLAYPLLLYASSVLYPQVAGCLLITLIALLVTREPLRMRDAVLAGLAYGVLILAIPYFILLLPFVCVFMILERAAIRWRALWPTVLMGCIAAMIVIPWTVRNYVQFHQFVPISTNNGRNLFIGNSPITTPNSGVAADVIPLCSAVHEGMTEYDYDAAMRRCATEWISQHPLDAAKLYAGKVLNNFNYRNEMATPGQATHWVEWVEFATYYPLLLLALVRLASARRYPLHRAEILIYMLYFINAPVAAVFFTRVRLRIPFDFMLIAVNAAFLARWWAARRSSAASTPAGVTA